MGKKNCIFCQGSGMSKEHFWPDWLRSHFNTTNNDKHTSEVHSSEAKSQPTLKSKNERPGNLITKKFRVVCETCNSGWMSQLEKSVKPLLIPLIENNDISFNQAQLTKLAKWAVMKVIVAEQSEDDTQVTPESDRNSFYENLVIPEYFRVYIGKHKTGHNSAYVRHSMTFALSKENIKTELNGMKRNTQSVSFLLGPLFVHVIACRVPNYEIWHHLNLQHLYCIFPDEHAVLSWPEIEALEQPLMSDIVHSLDKLISSPMVRDGGPLPC